MLGGGPNGGWKARAHKCWWPTPCGTPAIVPVVSRGANQDLKFANGPNNATSPESCLTPSNPFKSISDPLKPSRLLSRLLSQIHLRSSQILKSSQLHLRSPIYLVEPIHSARSNPISSHQSTLPDAILLPETIQSSRARPPCPNQSILTDQSSFPAPIDLARTNPLYQGPIQSPHANPHATH